MSSSKTSPANPEVIEMNEEFSGEGNFEYKPQLIKTGIFAALIVVLGGLLISLTLLSRSFWRDGLRNKINSVLALQDSGMKAGEWCKIDSNLTSQISAYRAVTENNQTADMYLAICRVNTIYGPLPAVFKLRSTAIRGEFVSFCDLSPRAEENITQISMKSQISYWEAKLPEVLKTVIEKDGAADEN